VAGMSNNMKRIFVLLCGIKKGDKGLGKKEQDMP